MTKSHVTIFFTLGINTTQLLYKKKTDRHSPSVLIISHLPRQPQRLQADDVGDADGDQPFEHAA